MSEPANTEREADPENKESARVRCTLRTAFERGDYAALRRQAAALPKDATEGDRSLARALVGRTRPDPLVYVLLGITAALLVGLTVYWEIAARSQSVVVPVAPSRPADSRGR